MCAEEILQTYAILIIDIDYRYMGYVQVPDVRYMY